MPTPTFSIIITTVDRPALLLDAVNSVLAQTCRDFELIVVNDGGPPLDALLGHHDPRIVLLRLPGKSGPGRARNQGAAIARGRYIGFLDDDDLFHPDHLVCLLAALDNAPDAVAYSDAVVYHEVIENGVRRLLSQATPWQHTLFIRQRLWIHNFIPIQSFAVSLASFLAVGGFDEDLRAFEDWELLLKLASHHPFVHLSRVTSEVRLRPAVGGHRSQSVKTDRSEPAIIESIYQRYGDLGDPLIREARRQMRQSGFTKGPDFLAIDSSAAGIAYQAWLARQVPATPDAPAASTLLILVPASADLAPWLAATSAALAHLPGAGHRLVVLSPEVPDALGDDPRISHTPVASLDDFAGLTAACNAAIAQHACDWVAILPAGTTFDADIAHRLAASPATAVYTDHDRIIHPQGIRAQPAFKPVFDADLLAAEDYIGAALWLRREEILTGGGLQPFPGLWLQEALWRQVDRQGPGAVCHIAEPLLHLPAGETPHPLREIARQAVVEQHLSRRLPGARLLPGPLADTWRIEYPLPAQPPRVSVVVTAPAERLRLADCLAGLVGKTDYPDWEILIAAPGEALSPEQCSALGAARGLSVRAPALPAGTSPAAARNQVAMTATGSILVFLAGSTEILHADWLAGLVRHCLRPEVGAVGARLLGPDGRVAGGGIILGPTDACPAFFGLPHDDPGYMNRAQLTQQLSAVSHRCLAVSAAVFRELGGFAADDFPDRQADVDFCLRLGATARTVVWTPAVTLADHAPVDDTAATPALARRWAARLAPDPAYLPGTARLS